MKHHFGTILLFLSLFFNVETLAQLNTGLDIYNRYIWRGVDYGNAPSLQPSISYSSDGFSVGTWAAYGIGSNGINVANGSASVFAEHDIWTSYTFSTASGSFTLLFTDYFYPSAGLRFFNYQSSGGAHVLEIGGGYSGMDSFPVTMMVYYNFHNDVDHSGYLQVSYPFLLEQATITVFAAGTPAKSTWYAASKSAFINTGVTVTKIIKITETLSLPVNSSFIINPHLEQSFLTFGISL